MAPYTYYFIFSLSFVLIIILHIANMLYFRTYKRTLTGNVFKPNTPEYLTSMRLSNRRNMSIAALILILATANFIYSVISIIQVFEKDALAFFTIISLLTIAIFVGVIAYVRHIFGGSDGHNK